MNQEHYSHCLSFTRGTALGRKAGHCKVFINPDRIPHCYIYSYLLINHLLIGTVSRSYKQQLGNITESTKIQWNRLYQETAVALTHHLLGHDASSQKRLEKTGVEKQWWKQISQESTRTKYRIYSYYMITNLGINPAFTCVIKNSIIKKSIMDYLTTQVRETRNFCRGTS